MGNLFLWLTRLFAIFPFVYVQLEIPMQKLVIIAYCSFTVHIREESVLSAYSTVEDRN